MKVVKSLFLTFLIFSLGFTALFAQQDESFENEQILDQIEVIKFSNDNLKKQKAVNYLYKNLDKTSEYLYKELVNKDNSSMALSNFLNILTFSDKKLKADILWKSAEIQKMKTLYIYYLMRFFYTKQPAKVASYIKKFMLNTGSLDLNTYGFKLVSDQKIAELKHVVINKILKTNSYYLQQSGLHSLSYLALTNAELEQLSPFLKSIDSGVRQAAVAVIREYPSLFEHLKNKFEESEDFFERASIIEIVTFYRNQKSFDFLINLLRDEYFVDLVMGAFLNYSVESKYPIQKVIEMYRKTEASYVQFSTLKILSSFLKSSKQNEKKVILEFFKQELKKQKNKEILLYITKSLLYSSENLDNELIKILKQIKKKYNYWRLQKIIVQILDLRNEN